MHGASVGDAVRVGDGVQKIMSILDKLKSFFASGGTSLTRKRCSAILAYVRSDVDPESSWSAVEKIGDGAFGNIFKVI